MSDELPRRSSLITHHSSLGYTVRSKMAEVRYAREDLERLATRLLVAAGVGADDAAIAAEGLVAADQRGVSSHGLAHLPRRLERLAAGLVVARPREQIVRESPISAVLDAGGGLGIPPSRRAM